MRAGRAGWLLATWMAGMPAWADEPPPPDEERRPRARHGFVARCQADGTSLCPGIEPGDGALARCLAEKSSEVGKPCRAALRRAKRVGAFRAACGADLEVACAGVEPGKGRIRECLRAHQAALSDGCRALLERRAGGKKAAAEDAAVADEAAVEVKAGLDPIPASLPLEAESPEPRG